MVARLGPLAVVAHDRALAQARDERLADEREVDPQAHTAVEMALAVVPPGEALLARVQVAVGVDEPGARIARSRERSSSVTCVEPANAAGS